MKEFKRRHNNKDDIARFALGVAVVVVLGALALGAARAAWGMYGKLAQASEAALVSQSELEILQAQQARITAAVAELSSPRGVEAQVRQRYGVAKPGEGEIDIVGKAPEPPNASAAPQQSIWGRIFHALFVW